MAETGRNADALQQEIERTRDELARTVDSLAERVSPKNVAQRTFQQVKDDAAAARKKLPSGGSGKDFHEELAHRESESQASLPAGGTTPSPTSAVGETLRANSTVIIAGVVGVLVVVTVVTWRRTRS